MPKFTPTELRILDVLRDGAIHKKAELWSCLGDQMATRKTLAVHLHRIRRKIQPVGQDILCVYRNRNFQYQWVRLLHDPGDE